MANTNWGRQMGFGQGLVKAGETLGSGRFAMQQEANDAKLRQQRFADEMKTSELQRNALNESILNSGVQRQNLGYEGQLLQGNVANQPKAFQQTAAESAGRVAESASGVRRNDAATAGLNFANSPEMQALDKRVKQSELAKNEANQRASNRYESIQDLELRKVWLDANNQIEKEAEALFKDMLNTMSPKGSWDAFAALDGTDVAREREKIVANALAEKNDYITRAKDRLITAFTDKSGKPMLPGMAAQAPKSGVSGALPPPAGASAEGTLIFKKKTSPVASTGTASGPRG